MCVRFPRAAPVYHTEPAQSGRSWICADWMEAASQSALGPDLHHYTGKEKEGKRGREKGIRAYTVCEKTATDCFIKCTLRSNLQSVNKSNY